MLNKGRFRDSMKKSLLVTVIITVVTGSAGCAGKADAVSNSAFLGTSEITETDNASDESNLWVSAKENNDLATSQEKMDVIKNMKRPKSRAEVNIDDESAALYDKFLADEAKATFYKNGDHSDFYYLSDFLEDGEKYTLSEIIDGEISYKRDRNQENWKFDYFTDSYIDCGLDGDIEILVELYFEESYFPLYMIIKNVAGNLKICFIGYSNGRQSTNIEYNGVVYSDAYFGCELHTGDYSYIDAEGKYNSWYKTEDSCYFGGEKGDSLYHFYNVNPNILEGVEELCLCVIKFDNEQEYSLFFLADSDGKDIEDNPINGINPHDEIRKLLIKEGYTIISTDEATTLIDNRRREIGLTDEIYCYEG